MLFSKAKLYHVSNKLEESEQYFNEALVAFEQIPAGAFKCFMLLNCIMELRLLKNENDAATLIEKLEKEIKFLKPTIKNHFHLILFTFNVLNNNSEKMEFYARQFPENNVSIEDSLNDLEQDINSSNILKNPKSGGEIKEFLSEHFQKTAVTEIPPRIFGLFAAGEIYLKNNETEKALRIFSELNQIDDSYPVTFKSMNITNLKMDINEHILSIYEKMLIEKDFSTCAKIKLSNLITSEAAQKIEEKLQEVEELRLQLEKLRSDFVQIRRSSLRELVAASLVLFIGLALYYNNYLPKNIS